MEDISLEKVGKLPTATVSFLGCFAEELCHSACLKRFWIDVCTTARDTLLYITRLESDVL